MFDRILLVLDDLGDPNVVLPHLRIIARAADSHVILMKTVPFLESLMEMPHELAPDAEGDDEAAEIYVSGLVEKLKGEGFDVEGFANIGRSGLSIAAAAERVEASLIIIASTRAWSRVGTLLRATSVPVYVIPPNAIAFRGRTLIPIDRTEGSLDVLPAAAGLALACRSGAILMQCWGPEPEPVLHEVCEALRRQGIPADHVLRPGDPSIEIVRACVELQVGQFAMRSDGTAGGVIDRLLHRLPVPLLVVRRALVTPAESTGAFRVPLQIHAGVPVGVAMWTHRTPANPLLGSGDIGD
jgi:nucleotide-binding universal stress UspA family protein